MPSLSDRRALLDQALAIMQRARETVLGKVAQGFEVDRKADGSYLTEADLASERVLREGIAERFPDHGIVGEELPPRFPDSEFQWILDPIDGTHSFARGIPLYGILLALRYRGQPLVGVIDLPGLLERYSGATGLGAWCNERRLHLEDLPGDESLADQLVATGERSQFLRVGQERGFDRLMQTYPHARSYCDAFGHGLVARGAVGAMVDFGLRVWDMAATEVIVPEAGGRFAVVGRHDDQFDIIFGKPRLVDALTTLFR